MTRIIEETGPYGDACREVSYWAGEFIKWDIRRQQVKGDEQKQAIAFLWQAHNALEAARTNVRFQAIVEGRDDEF
jgi:hypothetical protein